MLRVLNSFSVFPGTYISLVFQSYTSIAVFPEENFNGLCRSVSLIVLKNALLLSACTHMFSASEQRTSDCRQSSRC